MPQGTRSKGKAKSPGVSGKSKAIKKKSPQKKNRPAPPKKAKSKIDVAVTKTINEANERAAKEKAEAAAPKVAKQPRAAKKPIAKKAAKGKGTPKRAGGRKK